VSLFHQLYGVPHAVLSATPSRGSCSGNLGPFIDCALGTIPAGDSASVELVVVPAGEGTLFSSAFAGSPAADYDFSNNGSLVAVEILPAPEQLLDSLIAVIESHGLRPGIERVLIARLDSARGAIAAGNPARACFELEHFLRLVRNLSGRLLSLAGAAELDAAAREIASLLGCFDPRVAGGEAGGVRFEAMPSSLGVSSSGGGARIRLTLPARERARIDVFDVGGRLVRAAFDGDLEAGSHEIHWDGRIAEGHRARAGVYFVRAQAGARRAFGRIVVLR
jgi:hypothetical protein